MKKIFRPLLYFSLLQVLFVLIVTTDISALTTLATPELTLVRNECLANGNPTLFFSFNRIEGADEYELFNEPNGHAQFVPQKEMPEITVEDQENLKSSVTYYYRIRAKRQNPPIQSGDSHIVKVETQNCGKSDETNPPTTITVTPSCAGDRAEALVAWGEKQNAISYDVHYAQYDLFNKAKRKVNTQDTNVTLIDLERNTEYQVFVNTVYPPQNLSTQSNIVTFKTLACRDVSDQPEQTSAHKQYQTGFSAPESQNYKLASISSQLPDTSGETAEPAPFIAAQNGGEKTGILTAPIVFLIGSATVVIFLLALVLHLLRNAIRSKKE